MQSLFYFFGKMTLEYVAVYSGSKKRLVFEPIKDEHYKINTSMLDGHSDKCKYTLVVKGYRSHMVGIDNLGQRDILDLILCQFPGGNSILYAGKWNGGPLINF